MATKKILVAATQHGQELACRVLSQNYELTFVSTLSEAEKVLQDSEITIPEARSNFDIVICSVHFDDSRMFDLLQHIRKVDHYDKLPFLVITAVPSILPMDGNTRTTAQLLGAYGFLELSDLSKEEAKNALNEAVEQGLKGPGTSVKSERIDKGKKNNPRRR